MSEEDDVLNFPPIKKLTLDFGKQLADKDAEISRLKAALDAKTKELSEARAALGEIKNCLGPSVPKGLDEGPEAEWSHALGLAEEAYKKLSAPTDPERREEQKKDEGKPC